MNIVNVGYASTNYYVLATDRPHLLIDAGWPNTLPQFQHTCKRAGIKLSTIPYLLVTHYHPDHAGLAQDLKQFGLQLIVLETQKQSIPLLQRHMKPQDHYSDIDMTDNLIVTAEESRSVLQGIDILGETVSTPGHSDDSLTLVLDTGEAFTGDLTPPWATMGDPLDPVQQSWAKIRAHNGTIIYPGHGPVWSLKGA